MANVQIFLDNYNGACQPGQTISGRIECLFSETKNVRAIRVKFEGQALTHWTETEKYYDEFFKEDRTRDVNYTGDELYFSQEYTLTGGGEFMLGPGRHAYPFSYILPQHLPSSFEDEAGSVRYTIVATVDCPWRFNLEAKAIINIVSILDLNYLQGAREPVGVSVDKTMCSCWCNDSGALTLNISLPVSGYTPGQVVKVNANIENLTNVKAERIELKMIKVMEYTAQRPHRTTRTTEVVLARCSEHGVGAHGEKAWTSYLAIPASVQQYFPNLIPCNIINISYSIQAKVVVPCPHTNLHAGLPFIIGDVPLVEQQVQHGTATAPPAPYPPPAAEGDCASAPPSYDEAQKLFEKDGQKNGFTEYKSIAL